jgi:transcriptional regulator with XRE-family HTH domain
MGPSGPIVKGEVLDVGGFGARLRAERERRELSREELAKRAGVGPSAVKKWEGSQRQPRSRYLIALANALDVLPETLLGQTPLRSEQEEAYREGVRDAASEIARFVKRLEASGRLPKREKGRRPLQGGDRGEQTG